MKHPDTDLNKVETLKRSIALQVTDYYNQWSIPVSYEILNRSYGTRAKNLLRFEGMSLKDLVLEMTSEHTLINCLTPRGRFLVYPYSEELVRKLADGSMLEILADYDNLPLFQTKRASNL